MISIRPLILVALFLSATYAHSQEAKGFSSDNFVLYQPNDVLQARVPSVEKFAAYVKEIERVCQAFFAESTARESLNLVIAVRPDKTSKIWFISSTYPEMPKDRVTLRECLEKLPPCEVVGGPIAFAMVATIAGGDGKTIKPLAGGKPPFPKEWTDASKKKEANVTVPDGILKDVWPPRE
jgi:hypothetical protein